jgi:diacylglycerol kinase
MNVFKMLRSFRFAAAGLVKLLKSENNFQFHTLAAVTVIFSGLYFNLSRIEWIIIFIAISLVFMAEAFNTSLEKLCDLVSPEKRKEVADIKDIAAAGVLIATACSVVIGIWVFGSRITELFS